MIDQILFVMRQSPDWCSLSDDYQAAVFIDPSRYKPIKHIEGFPPNVEINISIWNKIFNLNYFYCRSVLKKIATNLLALVANSVSITENELNVVSEYVLDKNVLLFFHDDDDWFSPDILYEVSGLDLGDSNIATFPIIKFDKIPNTCIRDSYIVNNIVGKKTNGIYRFQTNNYALNNNIILSDSLQFYRDHVEASLYADQYNIKDKYFSNTIISATNKTPCSASKLSGLVVDPAGYIQSMREYVMNLKSLQIPDKIYWCKEPLAETIALFEAVLDSARL